jgi:pSer/pThr/pTyr-binding forkhead associated (FHA) protein
MSLALKVLNGPLKDGILNIKEGLTFGRQGTDVVLNGPQVSSLHARIVATEDGGWRVVDNNSKNGVRVDGERAPLVDLKAGGKFEIGGFHFEVIELARRPSKTAEAQAQPAAQAAANPAPTPKKKKKTKKYWHEALYEFLEANADKFKDKVKPLTPLEPAVILEFVKGVQVNAKWTLGYGPRKVGSNSFDLPIWEPGAPAVCFELRPTLDGILFTTKHPEIVRINGESVDGKVLHMGDTIQIMDTLIEVDFSP